MILLPEADKASVLPFFAPDIPSRVWLDGWFQNRVPGVAYVDRLPDPSLCLVVTEFHHVTFVGWSRPPRDFTTELAEVLEQEVYLGLVAPLGKDSGFPSASCTEVRPRLEFRERTQRAPTPQSPSPELASLSFAPIDSSNFDQCVTKGECLYAYETKQRFLAECFGLVAILNGDVVGNAEAICQSADASGTVSADVQIAVAEPWRRRGVGRVLAEALLRHMGERGVEPIWSCQGDNEASLALARALGFGKPRTFAIQSYETNPGLQKYWRGVLARLGARPDNVTQVVQKLQAEFELARLDAHWLVVTYLREQ